jgi:hypothetical protein
MLWAGRHRSRTRVGFQFPGGASYFSLFHNIRSLVKWVPGALSPKERRQGLENDLSSPSSADVKNGGAIPPLPVRLHVVVPN